MLNIMYSCKYPHLFSSIIIGNKLFKNRLFASPTGVQYSLKKNLPIAPGIAYYERKAIGGAASVCIGDVMVDSEIGLTNGEHIELDDPGNKIYLTKLSDAITRHGTVASMELSHGGNAARISYALGRHIYGPVECDSTGNLGERIHAYEMTPEVMAQTKKKHAEAAAFAKRCGFGMVTLHGGHGWLLHQFMSPTMNTRRDQYGGSFENRMRFPLEIIEAIRTAVGPGFPIEIRISGSECYEGGYDISYGIEIAKALDGKVDLIHVSAGSHEDPRVFTVTHPSMFLEDGVNVKYAAEIKKHMKFSKVATVGALSDPRQLEDIIASGKADVVELARGLICDPDLPVKARAGRDEDITKCMRCFACFSNLISNGHIICALNPEISNEAEIKYERPAARKKTVLVAGGGIGGMQAALTAHKRGHRVILCEKADRLGGVLRCEERVPFKQHLHEYLEHQALMIYRTDIDVRLNTAVTPELARHLEPDVIIAGLGARPLIPNIRGIESPNVISAEELYISPERAGRKIVILGGGLVGSELAIYMGDKGHDVTILELFPKLNDGGNILQGQAIGIELERIGVKIALGTRALEINDSGVIGESNDGLALYDADTVVCAVGMKPLWEKAEELRLCAPEFYQIGDCVIPKNITEATRGAYFAALDIGRC